MTKLGLNRVQLILSIAFVCILVIYILYAFSGYIRGTRLEVSFPYHGYSTTSPLIKVTGNAPRAQFISLNDRPIYIDEQGAFSETLLLNPGYTIIKVFVRDRFGREQSSLMYVLRTE